jgi:hypothetical protein
MNLRALMFLGFAIVAQPVFAQTATTNAPTPTTASATADSLLAAGYVIRTVTTLSDAAIKEVFTTGGPFPSQVFITLQKGTSVAVCEMATISWISVDSGNMTDATRCKVR